MLRTIRIILAVLFLAAITYLFLDFTGTASPLFGWMAKIQFMPAVLSLNVAALVFLALLTVVFGRVYCSVICPLGVTQDVVNWLRGKIGPKKTRKNRFAFRPAGQRRFARIAILAIFVVLAGMGAMAIASLIEPYSEFGRIVNNLLAPVYDWGNNILADMSANRGDYDYYHIESPAVSWAAIAVAAVTLLVVVLMSWFGGRDYCNTICPVGTILGYLSQISVFKPVIDLSRCNGCKKCARNCKASCIDATAHKIDYTRCVSCMDCVDTCSTNAIKYTWRRYKAPEKDSTDESRRRFMAVGAIVAGAALAKAEEKTTDGGLAVIIPKERPGRKTKIVPPGALSVANLERHCTSCQLCISECPNGVLRPSMELSTFMQPEVSYEKGYCRPECVACSAACPTGAIIKIDRAEKSSIAVGHAVVDLDACLSANGSENCGNCSRHCPAGAIEMVAVDSEKEDSPLMPVVNDSACIGCGACENLCPVSPLSAIHVEGYEMHHTV